MSDPKKSFEEAGKNLIDGIKSLTDKMSSGSKKPFDVRSLWPVLAVVGGGFLLCIVLCCGVVGLVQPTGGDRRPKRTGSQQKQQDTNASPKHQKTKAPSQGEKPNAETVEFKGNFWHECGTVKDPSDFPASIKKAINQGLEVWKLIDYYSKHSADKKTLYIVLEGNKVTNVVLVDAEVSETHAKLYGSNDANWVLYRGAEPASQQTSGAVDETTTVNLWKGEKKGSTIKLLHEKTLDRVMPKMLQKTVRVDSIEITANGWRQESKQVDDSHGTIGPKDTSLIRMLQASPNAKISPDGKTWSSHKEKHDHNRGLSHRLQ